YSGHEIEIGIACRDVVQAVHLLHVGRRKVASPQEIVVDFRLLEFVLSGWRVEGVYKLPVERRGKHLARVVSGEHEIRATLARIPNGGVVQVHRLHGFRSVQHPDRSEIGADLKDSRSGKSEVGLPFSGPAVHRKAAMSLD